jgi:MYXO-CTERM domain-containing protein
MRLNPSACAGLLLVTTFLPSVAAAGDAVGYHPYLRKRQGIVTVDMSSAAIAARRSQSREVATTDSVGLGVLDRVARGELPADPDGRGERTPLPDDVVQRGSMVLPRAIDDGSLVVEPDTIFSVEDIPGNEYPRKHTLYLNFIGADLKPGTDNSAENTSSLARAGQYPVWGQGETKAVAIAQGVQNDFAPFGVTVVYETRPEQVIPYTMAMMGGDWQDTGIDSPAGGVAPGADCGALGQRHVVYAFESASSVQMANTASQEAGHAYGLDHSFNCNSVMSYCAGGDGSFQTECAGLCEAQCQGPNSAGCQLTHEMFCGEGSLEQNDAEEMTWLFGGNEPDMEAPTVEIAEPVDGLELEAGSDVDFRAVVDDNYGGYAWKFVFYKDGEVALDEIDYERETDDQYRAARNLGNLDAGVYELHIEVYDHFGHMTEDVATVYVGGATTTTSVEPSDTGDGESAGETAADSDGEGGTASDDDTTAGSAGGDDDDSTNRGCNCDAGTPRGPGMLALLGVLGMLRARRRR